MDLYRIILVDDEEEVRKSIIHKINWNEVGFQVVGDAENGEDALEKIELLEPDVVLTDIRMPYMDGLTLSEKIRQKYPSMKIVIFSGYDDFEYAKLAIKLKVTEYILKPVNVEELTAILKRIKGTLDEEIEQKRNVTLLRENYIRSLPILKEQFLKDLISHTMEPELVSKRMNEFGIDLEGAKKWISIAVDLELDNVRGDGELPLHEEKELIPLSVTQIIEANLSAYYRHVIFTVSGADRIALAGIIAVDENHTKTNLIDILGDICKDIRKVLKVPVTIGIGHSTQELNEISVSFQSAVDALGYKGIVGGGSTIYITDVEPVSGGKLVFDKKEESDLIAAIKFGPEETIEAAVHGIMEKMNRAKVHTRQYQAYMLSISNCVIQLIQQYDLDMAQIFDGVQGNSDPFAAIPQLLKQESFDQWLLPIAMKLHTALDEGRDNATKEIIERAKQYIQENYQDSALSVEQICRYLHMSPAYFSTMFKKMTGQTYVNYLTEIRLNKAVELLNMTDDKTYVIASKVGYQEQNYFSYVFKKKFGVSPTKFRNK